MYKRQGRFYDPTVDALDVQSLRSDDQGTRSLVYDPQRDQHYWRDIPFQSPEFNASEDQVLLKVDADGAVSGELRLQSRGGVGQFIRKRARNPEALKQLMQSRVSQLFPGAQMLEHRGLNVNDLYTPALASINFRHDSWLKREGDLLRIPNIADWSPKRLFELETRRFPLVLGHYRQWRWKLQLQLPPRLKIAYLPTDREVGGRCLTIKRRSSWDPEARTLQIAWFYQSLCEQLSPKEYVSYRALSREMLQLLNEEVVLRSQKLDLEEPLPIPNQAAPPKVVVPAP